MSHSLRSKEAIVHPQLEAVSMRIVQTQNESKLRHPLVFKTWPATSIRCRWAKKPIIWRPIPKVIPILLKIAISARSSTIIVVLIKWARAKTKAANFKVDLKETMKTSTVSEMSCNKNQAAQRNLRVVNGKTLTRRQACWVWLQTVSKLSSIKW